MQCSADKEPEMIVVFFVLFCFVFFFNFFFAEIKKIVKGLDDSRCAQMCILCF